MAVDRSFPVQGHGTVVTGSVASGSVAVGDELSLWPEGRPVRVRGLHRHDRAVERLGRGSRAAVNLVGVHHAEVRRGQELAVPGYLEATRVLSVEVGLSPEAPRSLRHRGRYRLHLGTAEVTATLSLLSPRTLEPGGKAIGQLMLAEPVVAVCGQPFVLREESPPATLGGGRVLLPGGRRLRRRDAVALERLGRIASPDAESRAVAALGFRGLEPWTEATLSRDSGLAIAEIPGILDRLAASGALVALAAGPRRTVRALGELADEMGDRVLRALGRLHRAHPRQSAIRRVHLTVELPDLADNGLITGLIERLKAAGRVVADERTIALKGYEPKLSQNERKLKAELAEAIRAGGLSPPVLADLKAQAGSRSAAVPDLLGLLRDEGRIVEVGQGLFLDFDAETELRRRVSERLSGGGGLTMAELRDLLGTTRKFAVPIGEHLDRIGLTRREGDVRVLAPSAGSTGPA
jgi:selenocysteine-specific elongation factor